MSFLWVFLFSMEDEKKKDVTTKDVPEEDNKATWLTWLWAILFGPLYFWFHGFIGWGIIAALLWLTVYGSLLISPIAYYAWYAREKERLNDNIKNEEG